MRHKGLCGVLVNAVGAAWVWDRSLTFDPTENLSRWKCGDENKPWCCSFVSLAAKKLFETCFQLTQKNLPHPQTTIAGTTRTCLTEWLNEPQQFRRCRPAGPRTRRCCNMVRQAAQRSALRSYQDPTCKSPSVGSVCVCVCGAVK